MENPAAPNDGVYEWHSRSILLPRFGLLLDRNGTHFRLLMPGEYLVRRSRTKGKWLYRPRSPDRDAAPDAWSK
ncbi:MULTISPECIES: hypothetical protein [Sphingopyxis]|jgi:hypothetical protein|uniref:Uncharacterized protein n=1 Tax=Sphingopyxis granuli TaxID=267128 RepID=A0AA86GJ22_9SPHN|nr:MULTISPECIES: hypothetical protein [Sphingopyxis]AMG73677.1 Uncharacterized protein SGRAN_1285 [Sphingopyxis granuli]APW72174.1 hypothetical protein BWD40_04225 [Sphingopyxis granuli]AVA12925.1 hypothetical protein C3E99_02875 [Sphingopyxis sp. MG]ODU30410.1 MAG: hypothetical protein ABS88_05325 [Sphingopyxis sp. SCN 67-31]UNK80740.1 hypothetical protein MNQ96_06610 [Sphingopyxis granuli]